MYSCLTCKHKVIREKVAFALQPTNSLFITKRDIYLLVKPNAVQPLELFSVFYVNRTFIIVFTTVKDKAFPLQALTDPEVSRRLRLPDFKTIGT
jgi:hypothetical protein